MDDPIPFRQWLAASDRPDWRDYSGMARSLGREDFVRWLGVPVLFGHRVLAEALFAPTPFPSPTDPSSPGN
ncbi:MAG: hypothetical protein HQL57_06540, partial [Magnetococcales bacterium]|nr:hypothetical protein [Magnetococcales bacterium]